MGPPELRRASRVLARVPAPRPSRLRARLGAGLLNDVLLARLKAPNDAHKAWRNEVLDQRLEDLRIRLEPCGAPADARLLKRDL